MKFTAGIALAVGLLLVLLVLMSGCAAPTPSGAQGQLNNDGVLLANGRLPEKRADGEYWVIWLHGEATENGGAGPACDVPWDHSLDLGNRTLTYNWANRRPEGSDRAVVVSDVWTQGGCPLSYEIRASGWPIHVNGLGNLTIEVRDDGTVMVNGATAISQGQALHIQIHGISSFGGHLMGELNVENIGAWLTSGQSSRQ